MCGANRHASCTMADRGVASSWRRDSGTGGPITVLAHRGGAGAWRENTVEAFAGALEAGADGVELDVRRCADGTLVVHHDAEVPGPGLLHQCRRAELPDWVPTLEDALAACAGASVNVEIKNIPTDPGYDPGNAVSADVAACLATPRGSAPWPARVVVSSFWPDTLTALARAAAGAAGASNDGGTGPVALGLLVHPSLDATAALEQARDMGCAALHPHHSRSTAPSCAGPTTPAWPSSPGRSTSPAALDAVVAAGVDAVITDDVAATLSHLR